MAPNRSHRAAVATTTLLALAMVAAVGLQPVAGLHGGAAPDDGPAQTGVAPDAVLLRIHVQPDGDAAWRVEYRVRLDDANTTDAFESVRSDIEADPTPYADQFADRMGRTVAAAENGTGREMAVGNVTVTAERRQLPQSYGVITYAFDWLGFAAVEADRVVVGDAVAGLFLDGETTLLVSWPAGLRPVAVAPEPDELREGAAVWTGPVEFGPTEPRLELTAATPTTPGTPTTAAGPTDGGPGDDEEDRDRDRLGPLLPVAAGILGAVILGAIGVRVLRSRRRRTASASPPSDDLLSNEERVLALLRERDGRLKQQAIAEALGMTDATVSRTVRSLREDGAVEVFRLGRENVVSLPGHGPGGPSGRTDADTGE